MLPEEQKTADRIKKIFSDSGINHPLLNELITASAMFSQASPDMEACEQLMSKLETLEAHPVKATPDIKVIAVIEGGSVKEFISNAAIDCGVIDYDINGRDHDELFDVPQGDGKMSPAAGHTETASVLPERTDELWGAIQIRYEDIHAPKSV